VFGSFSAAAGERACRGPPKRPRAWAIGAGWGTADPRPRPESVDRRGDAGGPGAAADTTGTRGRRRSWGGPFSTRAGGMPSAAGGQPRVGRPLGRREPRPRPGRGGRPAGTGAGPGQGGPRKKKGGAHTPGAIPAEGGALSRGQWGPSRAWARQKRDWALLGRRQEGARRGHRRRISASKKPAKVQCQPSRPCQVPPAAGTGRASGGQSRKSTVGVELQTPQLDAWAPAGKKPTRVPPGFRDQSAKRGVPHGVPGPTGVQPENPTPGSSWGGIVL